MRDEDPLPGYGLDLRACAASHDCALVSTLARLAHTGTPLCLPCPAHTAALGPVWPLLRVRVCKRHLRFNLQRSE